MFFPPLAGLTVVVTTKQRRNDFSDDVKLQRIMLQLYNRQDVVVPVKMSYQTQQSINAYTNKQIINCKAMNHTQFNKLYTPSVRFSKVI